MKNLFFRIFGKKYTGVSITFNIENINHIYGELNNFIVESKKFTIHFTMDNVTINYK